MDRIGTQLHEPDASRLDPEEEEAEQTRRGGGTATVAALGRRALVRLRRPVIAGVVLFLVYVLASLATNPGGSLSSDIGPKVATLAAIEDNGGVDPDVGYWAEDVDPDGDLHPLFQTRHVGDRWIAVSTLPFLGPAIPLWLIGGYRAIVLLAMVGSVATAFAARAIARRLGARDGWSAYWLVGLASPIAIYALVFWEHSTGVALMAWAIVLLLDIMHGRRGWPVALAAGALFGVAATMRTEALLYGALAMAVVLIRILWEERVSTGGICFGTVRRVAGLGVSALIGVIVPLFTNELLERVWLGSSLRSSRAVVAAADTGGDTAPRLEEAFRTLLGTNGAPGAVLDALIGVLVIVPLLVGVIGLAKRRDRFVPIALILTSWLMLAGIFHENVIFVPGLFVASPLAAFGLVAMWGSRDRRALGAIALLAIPGVLLTSYVGGAAAQWGGRYLLVSGFLLVVVATLGLPKLGRLGAGALIVPAVALTLFGLFSTVQRSNALGDFGDVIRNRPEPVVVSSMAYQMREIGAIYEDGRYLTMPRTSDLPQLLEVLDEFDVEEFAFVKIDYSDPKPPLEIEGYEPTTVETTRYLSWADVDIVHYDKVP